MELNCFLQWRGSGCVSKRGPRLPTQRCCVSASTPSPENVLLRGDLLCKEPPRSVPPGSSPHWTFYACRCSVDGRKLCFSVSNISLFDLGLHILQRMWNISVDCCTPWCVPSSSVPAQPQAYKEKYQHYQILNAEICPPPAISEEEHVPASLETWVLETVKYLLNSFCINGIKHSRLQLLLKQKYKALSGDLRKRPKDPQRTIWNWLFFSILLHIRK